MLHSNEIKNLPQQIRSLVKQFTGLAKLEIILTDHLVEGCYRQGNQVTTGILDLIMSVTELHARTHATIKLTKAGYGKIDEVISYEWIGKGKNGITQSSLACKQEEVDVGREDIGCLS